MYNHVKHQAFAYAMFLVFAQSYWDAPVSFLFSMCLSFIGYLLAKRENSLE